VKVEQLPKSQHCQLLIEKTHELLEVSEALVKESRLVVEQSKQLLERIQRQRMRSATKWINNGKQK
jgi:hypothetical protein